MESWLQDNEIEVYSAHNDRNSAVNERIIRPLRNKIYKHTTAISTN